MIAREVRFKSKRSARRVTGRATNFRQSSDSHTHSAFSLPDSYQAWLSDGASREINKFYRA
jgi:hypothetical protein